MFLNMLKLEKQGKYLLLLLPRFFKLAKRRHIEAGEINKL